MVSEANDLLRSISPLIISLRAIGFSGYIVDKNCKLVLNKWYRRFIIVKAILICMFAIVGTESSLNFNNSTTFDIVIESTLKYCNLSYILLTYIIINKYFHLFVEILSDVSMVDAELNQLSAAKLDYKQTRRSIFYYYVVSYTAIISLTLIQFLLYFKGYPFVTPMRNIVYLIGNILSTGLESLVFCILRETRRRYSLLNQALIYMRRENETELLAKLQKIKAIYCKMHNMRKLFNSFSFQFLLKFFMAYIFTLSSIFFMAIADNLTWLSYVALINWKFISIKDIISTVYYYDSTLQEARRTAILYEKSLNKYDYNMNKGGLFYLKNRIENNSIRFCGLFDVNWKLLVLMAGSVITHLLILIQLKP